MLREPPFHPHPDLATDPAFDVVTVDVARAIQSFKMSLMAHEWMTSDGIIKPASLLTPPMAAARARIEAQFKSGQSIPMPVVGWGMFDCLEIGSGRDIFLTLAALGARHIPVHVPRSMMDHVRPFMVPGSSDRSQERGNILLYLLVCIVLLGALIYTISNTSRSNSATHLTDSQASALATEVLTYANHVQSAVSKLTLRGCTDTQISFENDTVSGYINASAPSDDSCNVFSVDAGTITWVTPPIGMNNGTPWFYTGAAVAHNSNGYASSNSASNADLVMMLFGLPENMCTKMNKQLGITGIPVNDGTYGDTTKFQGSYSYVEDINGLPEASQPSPCSSPSSAQNFCGKDAGCFQEEGGTHRNIFFQVLLRR